MFVIVKFGDNEEGVFNPQCRCVSLLSTIKEKTGTDEGEVELSDENGNVKNLRECPHRYANEILEDREILILLRVDKADTGICQFTPLLRDAASITEAFLGQLASKANILGLPGGRRSRSHSGRRAAGGKTPAGRPAPRDPRETTTKAAKAVAGPQTRSSKSRLK